jgi:hypothetical protein
MNNLLYPSCSKTFKKWRQINPTFQKVYNIIGSPKPFDVSLIPKGGINSFYENENNEKNIYKLDTIDKLKVYINSTRKHNVKNIDLGNIEPTSNFPIFDDSIPFLDLITNFNVYNNLKINNYVFIPNISKLKMSINPNQILNNFSFITSFSNSYQLKKTKNSLEKSDEELLEMLKLLKEQNSISKTKLYVSCFSNCPIEGKVDIHFIVNRLLKLSKLNVTNICLADPSGSLYLEDFEYIMDTCKFFGMITKNISLHLCVTNGNEKEVEKIIHKALDYKIKSFDVSLLNNEYFLENSLRIEKQNITNNFVPILSYELYYRALCNYILKNQIMK